ncbi:restriction endonuclease [Shewanella vaxholmensis]|uniref:restriction endonuclease n=1 Tax=Shewanella vaxholmensis TaxID=3063535 RepID=UPI0031898789
MTKLTIVEAAVEALILLEVPSTCKQVYTKIMERKLYKFGAKDPIAVLRIQMERHCDATSWSSEAKNKHFSKNVDGLFYLISDYPNKIQNLCISESSQDNLFLVKELAKKLKQSTIERIIDHLYTLESEEFESFCRRFLERFGFESMVVTQRGRDGGIDVSGYLEVGISQLHVAAQCKRYKKTNKVSRPDISQFRGDIQGDYQQGIFITTSSKRHRMLHLSVDVCQLF